MAAKLVVQDLQKRLGDQEVLRGASFTFEQGKIYGLIGRNGAGKTTFFNCLNEDLPRDGGSFHLVDDDGNLRPVTADDMGYVLSTPVVPEFLTAREFLQFFLEINRDRIPYPKAPDVYLDYMCIDEADRGKLLKDFSHGMKNKMQMLVNIMADPTVLLLDEPLTSFDVVVADEMKALLDVETPKQLDNVETVITGSVRELCAAAAQACRQLGYEPTVLTDRLCCQAKEAGSFLASIAKSHEDSDHALAFLAGGETVVQLTGSGLGGRNQELALAAAPGIAGMKDTVVFSLGSDGTDGPTDAAGGIVDGNTMQRLSDAGLSVHQVLADNDAYHALKAVDGLLVTGPTGTNVNDVSVVLIKR